MKTSLILLRIIGSGVGISLVIWAFNQFRFHHIIRRDFLLRIFLGSSLLIVSINPDSINIIADLFALREEQLGRLLTLLVISNLLVWILILGLRSKSFKKSVDLDLLVRHLTRKQFLAESNLNEIKEITVIIPAFNEAENLEQLLPKIPKSIKGYPLGVLLIDDKSTDNTIEVAQKHGYQVIANPINRGQGAALRAGYDIATAGGAEIIVAMDADGQHRPEEIERLIEPILEDKLDIVIGSRVLGEHEGTNKVRWLGIRVFSFIVNLFAGTNISDCANGYRAFRRDSLNEVILHQDQFNAAELIIDAAKKGVRIGEVPVTILRRFSGESKKGKNLSYGFNFSKTVLKTWLRK